MAFCGQGAVLQGWSLILRSVIDPLGSAVIHGAYRNKSGGGWGMRVSHPPLQNLGEKTAG
jgi:hypothetical protein